MAKLFVVTVEANHAVFPVDMLRYDRAIPYSERDAGKIQATFISRRESAAVQIQVSMPREPTIGRWNSFGWTVIDVQKREF